MEIPTLMGHNGFGVITYILVEVKFLHPFNFTKYFLNFKVIKKTEHMKV